MYKLRDWVNPSNLANDLSGNEKAVEYLENHEHLIDNHYIFMNTNAIHIIEKRIEYDKHHNINYNKNAVNFLKNNRQYINYGILCGQEHGIEFVDELIENGQIDKICWRTLSKNPAAMHILNDPKYYQYINWFEIICNKNAGELVKNNLHKVDQYWGNICMQPHLINLIEENMDNVHWEVLARNYNAIHILENNIDKVDSFNLCWNKYGFKLLLQLRHVFHELMLHHENIVFEYFDYCENNNIPFNLISQLSEYGYTDKHMDFLKNNCHHMWLSMNPNIFEYDYKRMRETRQSLLWYNGIKK